MMAGRVCYEQNVRCGVEAGTSGNKGFVVERFVRLWMNDG